MPSIARGGCAFGEGYCSPAYSKCNTSTATPNDSIRAGARVPAHLRRGTGMKAEQSPAYVHENIAKIAKMEEESLESRSLVERVGDGIASFAGSMGFVVLHLLWF